MIKISDYDYDLPDDLIARQPSEPRENCRFFVYNTKNDEIDFDFFYNLHDCGIVYYPNHPYLVCIMTKGLDFLDLENIIKNISNLIYKEIFLENQNEGK